MWVFKQTLSKGFNFSIFSIHNVINHLQAPVPCMKKPPRSRAGKHTKILKGRLVRWYGKSFCFIRSTGNKLSPVQNTGNKVPKTFDFLCIGMSIQPLAFDQAISETVVSVTLGKGCDKINGS